MAHNTSTNAWVYILQCYDGSYYTGSTTKFESRISEHKSGKGSSYTASRLPVRLLWYYEFSTIWRAVKAERQIKGWSRAKKEALMRGDFSILHELAQSKEMRERRKKRGNDK